MPLVPLEPAEGPFTGLMSCTQTCRRLPSQVCGLGPIARWHAFAWHMSHGTGCLADLQGTYGCESIDTSFKPGGAAS